MNRNSALVLVSILCGALGARAQDPDPLALVEALRPDAGELLWREIPWRARLGAAALEAAAADRPVLLWAMNGHPLGCT